VLVQNCIFLIAAHTQAVYACILIAYLTIYKGVSVPCLHTFYSCNDRKTVIHFFSFPTKKEEGIRIKMESAAKNASGSWENLLPEMFRSVKKKKEKKNRVNEWVCACVCGCVEGVCVCVCERDREKECVRARREVLESYFSLFCYF